MDGKKLIIFDKDGTLMDTTESSMRVIEELAKRFGLPTAPRERWIEALSGSFGRNIKWLYDLTDEQVPVMAIEYAKLYGEMEAYYDFREYPGICETVIELAGRYMLSVATMMFRDYAVKSLKAMDLDGCFITIEGVVMDRWLSKQDQIHRCLDTAGVSPEETVMIGDSMDDLESARKAGIDFVGVTYGFELTEEDCKCEGIPYATTPAGLLDIL